MKPQNLSVRSCTDTRSSIHPQGWVPIETLLVLQRLFGEDGVAFTPKGGCPLKPDAPFIDQSEQRGLHVAFTPKGGCPLKRALPNSYALSPSPVAFTPKGGCPLKHSRRHGSIEGDAVGSIHPQGWVPIETHGAGTDNCYGSTTGSIHPQGWVPIETRRRRGTGVHTLDP